MIHVHTVVPGDVMPWRLHPTSCRTVPLQWLSLNAVPGNLISIPATAIDSESATGPTTVSLRTTVRVSSMHLNTRFTACMLAPLSFPSIDYPITVIYACLMPLKHIHEAICPHPDDVGSGSPRGGGVVTTTRHAGPQSHAASTILASHGPHNHAAHLSYARRAIPDAGQPGQRGTRTPYDQRTGQSRHSLWLPACAWR